MKTNDSDIPVTVTIKKKPWRILKIQEVWEAQEGWWRPEETFRRYFRVTLEGDRDMTIFRDLVRGGWYRQNA